MRFGTEDADTACVVVAPADADASTDAGVVLNSADRTAEEDDDFTSVVVVVAKHTLDIVASEERLGGKTGDSSGGGSGGFDGVKDSGCCNSDGDGIEEGDNDSDDDGGRAIS